MKNIERNKRLQCKLKDEYPIKFKHQRKRGDQYNKPIIIQLPAMSRMKDENVVLYNLTKKKAVFMYQDVDIINGERDNDIEYLLKLENKNNDDNKSKGKDKDDKDKKKKKKKKNKEKEKEKKANERGNVSKMECDDDDEDDDIKMGMAGDKKPKLAKQNTLTKYFVKGKQEKIEQLKEIQPPKTMNIVSEKKEKKRRVVMCELIE